MPTVSNRNSIVRILLERGIATRRSAKPPMSMRRFAIMLAIASTCLGALGQGKVTFGNDSNHLFVLNGDPIPVSPLPSGRSLIAALYAGTSAGTMTLQTYYVLDATNWGPMPGRMQSRPVILSGVPGAAIAWFNIVVSDVVGLLGSPCSGRPLGNALYWGSSGNFTATPGASISYPGLVPGGPSGSTWTPGPLEVNGCLSCMAHFIVVPSNVVVSLGGSVTFSAYAVNAWPPNMPVNSYQWRKEGSPISGATNSGFTLSHVTLSDAGKYDVLAFTVYGGTASPQATLTVVIPAVAASLGSPTYTVNDQFQFTVTGTAGSNYVVQVATNLSPPTTWISLLTNASPFTFVQTNAKDVPQRFYRALAR
jgi:hypothetical protein